jgi:hypothetical protein
MRRKACKGTEEAPINGDSFMNGFYRLLHIPTALKQIVLRFLHPIASLALIATLSVATSTFQANADDPDQKNPVVTVVVEITVARAEVLLKVTDGLLSGKMTPANAAKKMISFEEGAVEKMEYLRGILQRIELAVDSEAMTREEADAKFGAMLKNKKENSGHKRANAYLKKVEGEITEAVANGTMTSEEGKAKYAVAEARIEQRMAQTNEGNKHLEEYLEKVGAEIKEAVANGTMTPEEGKAKYEEKVEVVKQHLMAAKAKIAKEESNAAVAKITIKFNAGEITREQMQQQLDSYNMRVSASEAAAAKLVGIGIESRKITTNYCMVLRLKLAQAIKDGEMTEEIAAKIWEDDGC